MNKIDQGYQLNGKKLEHWSVLLKKWISLITNYCLVMKGDDAPYYYSERANIGVLAGAAWKTGWLALEEFSIKKRGQKRGSSDLWIYPTNLEREEYIEAKQAWSINSADDKLSQAVKDVRKLPKDKDYIRIGVAFVCHGIHEKFEPKIRQKIQQVIETAIGIECDAIAWSFPVSSRKLRGGSQFNHIIYPGVLLLVKVAD